MDKIWLSASTQPFNVLWSLTTLGGEVNCSADYRLDASGKGVNVARVVAQLEFNPPHHLGSNRINEFWSSLKGTALSSTGVTLRVHCTCTTIYNLADRTTTELVEEPEAVHPQLRS